MLAEFPIINVSAAHSVATSSKLKFRVELRCSWKNSEEGG